MAEMKKEISQILLSLLQVGIQPMAETGTTHKWSQQRYIAIMSGMATPGEKRIRYSGKRRNQ